MKNAKNCNTEIAKKFLEVIDPAVGPFLLVGLHDSNKSMPVKRFMLNGLDNAPIWCELAKLNEKGYGIFFLVNENDGSLDRKSNNILGLRALFADFDDPECDNLATIRECALKPSIVVNTSPGKYHAYWPLDKSTPLEAYKSSYPETLRRIAAELGSDPNVCDITRIMRLPGFYHNKQEPFLCNIMEGI